MKNKLKCSKCGKGVLLITYNGQSPRPVDNSKVLCYDCDPHKTNFCGGCMSLKSK